MKVAELIGILQTMPQDAPVLVEFTSEMDGSPYLAEIDYPERAWVDKNLDRQDRDYPGYHEAVILK